MVDYFVFSGEFFISLNLSAFFGDVLPILMVKRSILDIVTATHRIWYTIVVQ